MIGDEFTTATGRWRVTDVGTRVVVAIKVSSVSDPSWLDGPPYAVVETVFDEHDQSVMRRVTGSPASPDDPSFLEDETELDVTTPR